MSEIEFSSSLLCFWLSFSRWIDVNNIYQAAQVRNIGIIPVAFFFSHSSSIPLGSFSYTFKLYSELGSSYRIFCSFSELSPLI